MIDHASIDSTLTAALAGWNIPGAAVALVQGDDVYTRGYGVCAAGEPAPVDEHTIFAIGSTTKAFTSALVGLLVDAGKLAWDDPVVKHLPDFAVADPWVTQHVTLRDLLCHRVGLERAQRLYYHGGYSQVELIRRMRSLRPVMGFRSGFQYANQNFGAAGLIVEAASGKTWDEFLTENLFQRLVMSRSSSGFDRVADFSNFAQPHAVLDETYPAGVRFFGAPEVVRNLQLSHEPSGSIHTTAADMAKWLQCLVAGAKLPDGSALLSPATFTEITTPQVVMQDLAESELAPLYFLQPGTHFWTYGLGWWVMDYQGEKVVMHGGQMPGYNSAVAFFPERKLGLAVMVNVHQTLAHAALFYALSDLLLGKPGRSWSDEFQMVARGYMGQVKGLMDQRSAERNPALAPTLAMPSYAGRYCSDVYGQIEVEEEYGVLTLTYGWVYAVLEHWQGDTFVAHWNLKGLLEDTLVAFRPDGAALTLLNDRAEYQRL
jgi:CubicO group peptidase (beta-lactamase class C family)